jgi:predicted XRE-type DNA-binding protein
MKRVLRRKNRTSITPSSGNVFSDLQLPDAEEKQTKVRLAVTINQIVESGSFSPAAVSEILKVNQRKISALVNYRLDGFSVDVLACFLTMLVRSVKTQDPSFLLAR